MENLANIETRTTDGDTALVSMIFPYSYGHREKGEGLR